jgi:hypothetical protein
MAIGVHLAEDHTMFREGVESIMATPKGLTRKGLE